MAIFPPLGSLPLVSADLPAALERHKGEAVNSHRTLKASEAVFQAWCRHNACTPMPASPQTVKRFINALDETKALATVQRYLSSITALHRMAEQPNPVAAPEVQQALHRIRRSKTRPPAQVIPLTRALIDRMLAAAPATTIGLRNKALLGVAYDTLARPLEMAALQIEDVSRDAATVQIRASALAPRPLRLPSALTPQTTAHLQAWQDVAPYRTGPLFSSLSHRSHAAEALNNMSITLIFKAMAAAAGVPTADIARISGQSTRVGATQDRARNGHSVSAIMRAGGWKQPTMVLRYIAAEAKELKVGSHDG